MSVSGKRAKDAGLFLRDATGQLLGEQTGKKNTIAWHVADALQSVHATTTAGQLSKKTVSYTDYGAETADTGRQFGYSGERRDPKGAGLVNYHARPYDPKTATWLQPDRYRGSPPNPATLNRTAFVAGNPVTLKDTRGYCPFCGVGNIIWGAAISLLGGSNTAWAPTLDAEEMAQTRAQVERDSDPRSIWDLLTDFIPGVYAVRCIVGFRLNCPAGAVALSATPTGSVVGAGVGAGARAASRAPQAYQAIRNLLRARAAAKTAAPEVLRAGDVVLPGVPKGAVGTPVKTEKGLEYAIPPGTPELNPRATSIRIMDATTTGPHPYPNGYAVYMNNLGQTVNPLTGRTIPPSDPFAHIELPR